MAFLVVTRGREPGRVVALDRDLMILGRMTDSDVVLDIPAVSRQHALLARVGDAHYVEDLKSRGGTYMNREQIRGRTQLHSGDLIQICDYELVFQEEHPFGEAESSEGATIREESLQAAPGQEDGDSQPPGAASPSPERVLFRLARGLLAAEELDPLLSRAAGALLDLFGRADRCFIALRPQPGEPAVPRIVRTRHPEGGEPRPSRTLLRRCADAGKALLAEGTYGSPPSQWRSVMCAPLQVSGPPAFGVLQIDTQDWAKPFRQADLTWLVDAARLIALAVQNARWRDELREQAHFEAERRLAHQLHAHYRPTQLPAVPGYDLFCHHEPVPGRGGLHDLFALPGGRLGVLLGEVAGRGFAAALLAVRLAGDARFALLSDPDPARALARVNATTAVGALDRYLTLVAGVLDPARHALSLVLAGQAPPLVYRHADGTLNEAVARDQTAPPLGIMDDWRGTAVEVGLAPGDSLVVVSNGVVSPPAGPGPKEESFGIGGLRSAVAGGGPAAQLGQQIVRAAHEHLAGRPPADAFTVLCVGRPAAS